MRFRIYKTTDADLRCAFDRKQFVPFYQPIYDTTQVRTVAAEVLARRAHPTLGILPPALFLKRVIERGYTQHMLRSICAQLPAFDPAHPINFNINLAFQELCSPEVFYLLQQTMQHLQQNITIEIPSLLFSNQLVGDLFPALHGCMLNNLPIRATVPVVHYTTQLLQQYAEAKFFIAIDNAAHSACEAAVCAMLPIHMLKYTVLSEPQTCNPALIARTTAMGIESLSLLQKALSMGFTQLQGNFIARPCGDFATCMQHGSTHIANILLGLNTQPLPKDEKNLADTQKSAC